MERLNAREFAQKCAEACDGTWHHHWHWPKAVHGEWDIHSVEFWREVLDDIEIETERAKKRLERLEGVKPRVEAEIERAIAYERDAADFAEKDC